MAKVVSQGECPHCDSSDAYTKYDDGGAFCFSCRRADTVGTSTQSAPKTQEPVTQIAGVSAPLPDRGISQATCEKYGVQVEFSPDGKIARQLYPHYDPNTNEQVAVKTRHVASKGFSWAGDRTSLGLFGQHTCRGRGKYITITEGEIDCLSMSQLFDNKYDAVSLRDGAGSAKRDIREQLEWLEGYDNIILCFDADAAGRLAVEEVRDLFSPNKLKIMQLPKGCKDANDAIKEKRIKELVDCFWGAKTYCPDGIVGGSDTWDSILKKRATPSVPYPWSGLNKLTRGMRGSELVTVTSGSGMGKSQIMREVQFHLFQNTDSNIGILALEEDVARTALGIMSVEANRLLHVEEDVDENELRPYWEATMGTGRFFLFDHFGSTAIDNIVARVRYMAKALDCQYVFLDHLSIVVSSQENGDERKAIDEVMTRLRTLVQETGITLFLVSHLRRSEGKSHEEGGSVSLGQLRGSQSIAQLSDMAIGMERNQQHEDATERNTTLIRVLKNRFTGETGPACKLFYDKDTGRMIERAMEDDIPDDSSF